MKRSPTRFYMLVGNDISVEQCLKGGLQPQGIAPKPAVRTRVARDAVVEKIAKRQPLKRTEIVYAESILLPELRPAIEITSDDYGIVDHPSWSSLNGSAVRKRLQAAIKATCRIENNGRLIGTGFLVAPDLVMTNRHVASDFVLGVGGATNIGFAPFAQPAVNFQREQNRPDVNGDATISVAAAIMMHPYFDVALLRLEQPAVSAPLALSADTASAPDNADIALIGYPDFNPDEDEGPQRDVLGTHFGVKRLQPGRMGATGTVRSYDKPVESRGHDSSTLTGNSGSPVVSLATGKVVGVHFYGRLRKSNWAVRASDLACDPRIVDAGVSFDGAGASNSGAWDDWWSRADSLMIAAGSFSGLETAKKGKSVVTITIPLTLKIDTKTGEVKANGKASFKVAKRK
ncbi:MAG: serine protease [Mesorhizobium sp.]